MTSADVALAATSGLEINSEESLNLSAGAQAGISVACGIFGLVAIAVVVVLLINRRRKRQRTGDWVSGDWNGSPVLRKYELPDLQQPQELPAQCQVELPAGILAGGTELESNFTPPKK